MSPRKTTPARQPRVPRPNPPSVQMEDTSQLWAVSYADFSMVLLSFFVVFFSVDKGEKSELIHSIMLGIHQTATASDVEVTMGRGSGKAGGSGDYLGAGPKKGFGDSGTNANSGSGTGAGAGSAPGSGSSSGAKEQAREPSSLIAGINLSFKNTRVVTQVTKEKIVVNFPDDLYSQGSVNLRGQSRKIFLDLVSQLSPYKEEIIVGFVGHSDSVRVRELPGRQITNNHDLSVVRASKALTLAATHGLHIENLYASGVGTELRQTRSLSVIIKPRGDGLL